MKQNNDVPLSRADMVVGLNQCLKGIRRGEINRIFLASDSDTVFKSKVLSESGKLPLDITKTSEELAELAGVEVPTAVIGIISSNKQQ